MVVPGIGIKFETITESQRQSLLKPVSQPSLATVPGEDLRKGAK
jgi:hypothetical protein